MKPGTSENEMRRIAEQLEQEQLVIITHYYTTVMMGFSFSVPFDNVESALTALEEEPSLEVIEEDQQMSIDPILSE